MSDISQIALNGVTYDVKDKTARTETDKKVSASGGDIASTKISAFTASSGSYPVPAANDTVKVGFGKIKKFFEDIRNATTGACFIGQIINNCVTDNAKLPLSAAQGKALMDLYTKLNSDLGNKIITKIQPTLGITEPFAQLIDIWDKLPAGTPFIGAYNNYGIRFYYGYIYPERDSGSIMLHDFSGQIIMISKVNNGSFTKRKVTTTVVN